ncbi:MAG TPA: LysR substrate-binding domain-containing protein [Rhizomicrobium sp.]
MNLKQLRYAVEVSRNGLSVSKAARTLNASQPGISQQIKALEESLGLTIFTRDKNKFTGITTRGESILDYAQGILFGMDCIKAVSEALVYKGVKELVIATTHTQARYVLPDIIEQFVALYPKIKLNVLQVTPPQIVEAITSGQADVGVSPVRSFASRDVDILRCREYERVIAVPKGHPLAGEASVTLAQVVKYPIITYERTIDVSRDIMETFANEGLIPNIRLTASDADVITTYIERGLGISILPEIVISGGNNKNIKAVRMDGVFPKMHTNLIMYRKRTPSLQCVNFVKLMWPRWNEGNLLSGS